MTWHVRHHTTVVIRVSTRMKDVFLDILELLDLVLVLLRQYWKGHRIKHNKDKPSVSDVLMKLVLGDVMYHLPHILLVNTQEIVQDNRRSHSPESINKFADTAHCIDVIRIAGIQAIVNEQRCHRA